MQLGCRPVDYWDSLPRERRERVYARIWKAFQTYAPKLAAMRLIGDYANEACERLFSFPHDLRSAPAPVPGVPSEEWLNAVENALVLFSTGKMLPRVASEVYRTNVSRGAGDIDGIEIEDPNSNIEQHIERSDTHRRQCDYIDALRAILLAHEKELAVHVLNAIQRFAYERTVSEGAAFRGETFQVNNAVLLEALRRKHPDIGWDLEVIQTNLNTLRYYARQLERKESESDGLLIFGTHRPRKTAADTPRAEAARGGAA
jgi:hypothetical protein